MSKFKYRDENNNFVELVQDNNYVHTDNNYTDPEKTKLAELEKYTAGTGIDITNGVISNTQTSAEWGNITGTLADQTDLNNALNTKVDKKYSYTIEGVKYFCEIGGEGASAGLGVSSQSSSSMLLASPEGTVLSHAKSDSSGYRQNYVIAEDDSISMLYKKGQTQNGVIADETGARILGLKTPTSDSDATPKKYVDDSISEVVDTIPTKTSELTNDSGFITGYTETDPVFSSSAAHSITSSDITNWNNKIDSSYHDSTKQNLITNTNKLDYSLLDNTPTIPTVNNATLNIQKNGTSVGTFTANSSSDVVANITVPTKTSDLSNDSGFIDNTYHDNSKQDLLVSGTNIKTINNNSILGSGDIEITIQDTLPINSIFDYSGSTVPEGYEEVDNPLEWKLLGQTTGTQEISLPSNFSELSIKTANGNVKYIYSIPKVQLSNTVESFRIGYVTSGIYGSACQVDISTTQAKITNFFVNESNVTDSSTMIIYYR